MKNRWLLNLGLAVLVAALLAIALYRPGAEPVAPVTILTSVSIDSIVRVRVQRTNQPDIRLEKTGGAWALTAPRAARANEFRINELLRLATAKSTSHFPAFSAELAKYGLDKPAAEVWLNDTPIRFGSMHPIHPQHYVLVDGQVHLIASKYFYSVSAGPADFFSHRLLEDRLKPVAFTLPGVILAQDNQGAWRINPANSELSNDRINTFVEEWRHAQALTVTPYSGKPAHEYLRIRFTAESPLKELELGILARQPELILYRKDEGLEYRFPQDVGVRLLQLKPE